jgi:hypothetical protein
MSQDDDYVQLANFLRERGHTEQETAKIIERVRLYDKGNETGFRHGLHRHRSSRPGKPHQGCLERAGRNLAARVVALRECVRTHREGVLFPAGDIDVS